MVRRRPRQTRAAKGNAARGRASSDVQTKTRLPRTPHRQQQSPVISESPFATGTKVNTFRVSGPLTSTRRLRSRKDERETHRGRRARIKGQPRHDERRLEFGVRKSREPVLQRRVG